MGLHPSLKVDSAGAQQRNVLNRIERIKDLMKKGLWSNERSVTALPKTKFIRLKTAKAAKAETPETAAAAGAAPVTTSSSAVSAGKTTEKKETKKTETKK